MMAKNFKVVLTAFIILALPTEFLSPKYSYANPKRGAAPEVKVNELALPEIIVKGKDETVLTDTRTLLMPKAVPTALKQEPQIKMEGTLQKVPLKETKATPGEAEPGCMYGNCCVSFFSRTVKGDEGHYNAATALYLKGDKTGAYKLYSKLIEKYPKSSFTGDAYYWTAEINYKDFNRPLEAKKFYKLVTDGYQSAKLLNYAYYSLAFIYFEEGNFKEAKKNADASFNAKPKSEIAEISLLISTLSSYYLNDYVEALSISDKILAIFPETKYAPLLTYIKGNVFYTLEKYDKAKKEFASFMDNYKESEFLEYNLYGLGQVNMKLGLTKESIAPNEELLKKSPRFKFADIAMYSLVKAYCFDDKLDLADSMLKKMETEAPNSKHIENAHYEIAYRCFAVKNYEEARKRFLLFLEKFPASSLKEDAYFVLAGAEFNLGRYVDSIKHYEIFSGISKNDALVKEALLNSAYAYALDNLPKEAAHALEKIVYKYGPDYGKINEVRYFLGESYYKMTDYEKAEASFSKIDLKDEYYPRAQLALGWIKFNENDFTSALDYFTNYLSAGSKENLAETYMVIAESYFNLKEYDKANENLKESVKNSKDNKSILGKANYLTGLINFKKEDYKGIIELLSNVASEHKEEEYADDSIYYLGLSQFQLEQYNDAANEFAKLINDYPDSPYIPQATLKTADCYYNLKRYTSAMLSYKSAVEKGQGGEITVSAEYGIIQTLYAQEDYESFVSKSKEFIKNYSQHPLVAIVYFQLAEYYSDKEDYIGASMIYEEMAKLYPKSEIADDALYKAGMTLYKAKKYEKALDDFLAMIKNYPDSILANETNYYIADSYFALKSYQDAVKYYDITTQDPKIAKTDMAKESFDKAAQSHLKLNNYSQAAKELVKSAEMFNEDPFDRTTYIRIGDIYFGHKEYETAISYYKKGVDSNYKGIGVSAQMKIADTYSAKGDFDTALVEYLKIIYLHKGEASYVDDAYIKTGNLYMTMGKTEEAKKMFLKLQEESLNPDKVGIAIEKLKALGVSE